MNIQIPDKLKQLVNSMTTNGISIPMINDCLTNKQSMTYTFTLVALILVSLGCLHITENYIDYAKALNFLQIAGSGYLGRQLMKHTLPLATITNKTDSQ